MFYGQTSNWRKQVEEVTHNGQLSYPNVASEYQDGANAIRVYCGAEAHVLLKVQIFLTTEVEFEAFDQFLRKFGLPRNGYHVIHCPPYPYPPAPVIHALHEQTAMIAPPTNY